MPLSWWPHYMYTWLLLVSCTLQQSITQLHYQLNSNSTYKISLKATLMMVCNRKQHSEECLKINAVQGKALHTLEILLWMLWTPNTPHVINMYKLYFYVGPSIAIAMGLAKIIISHDKVVLLHVSPALFSHYIVTHNEIDCGF